MKDGISQVLQTMEDLTRTISDVSINAERVAERSKEANELAKKGMGFLQVVLMKGCKASPKPVNR